MLANVCASNKNHSSRSRDDFSACCCFSLLPSSSSFFFFYRFLEWSRRVVSFANLSFLIALLFMNDSIILFQREMIFRSFQSLKIQVCRKIERINYFAIKKTPNPWRLSIWHRYIIPRVTFAIVTRGAFTTSSIQRQLRKDPARR